MTKTRILEYGIDLQRSIRLCKELYLWKNRKQRRGNFRAVVLCLAEGGDRGTAGAPNLPQNCFHQAFEEAFHKASPP